MERRVPLSSHTTGEVPTGQQLVRQPARGRQAVRERPRRNLTTLRRTATSSSTQSGSSGAPPAVDLSPALTLAGARISATRRGSVRSLVSVGRSDRAEGAPIVRRQLGGHVGQRGKLWAAALVVVIGAALLPGTAVRAGVAGGVA